MWGDVGLGLTKLCWLPLQSSSCCSVTHSCPQQSLVCLAAKNNVAHRFGFAFRKCYRGKANTLKWLMPSVNLGQMAQPPCGKVCSRWGCDHSSFHLLHCSVSPGRLRMLPRWERVVCREVLWVWLENLLLGDKTSVEIFLFLSSKEEQKKRGWYLSAEGTSEPGKLTCTQQLHLPNLPVIPTGLLPVSELWV